MFAKTRLMVVVAAYACCADRSFCQQEEMKSITVNVEVRDHEGNPIPDIALSTFVEPWRSVGTPSRPSSDSNGRLALTVSVPISAGLLKLVPAPAYSATQSPSETLQANRRFLTLKQRHAFQGTYRVPLDPQVDQYVLSIVTRPAIRVSARLVGAEGDPLSSGIVVTRFWQGVAGPERDGPNLGRVELVGVPRSEPVQLIVINDGRMGRFLQLSAEQTQANLDLGDIVLDPIVGPAKARLLLAAENPPRPGSIAMWTLVSEDGATIITVIVDNADGRPRTPWLEPSQGWLPPGRYYVLPNAIGFGGDDTGWLLLDLIRAGKAGDHPELISFVAAANEEAAVTLDPEEINAKIKAAAQAEGMLSE